jgi:hypothetical protein
MTLSKKANGIRSQVQSPRKGPGRKYTKALRERVLSWMERRATRRESFAR